MGMRITCPSCHNDFRVGSEMRGRKVRCSECDRLILVAAGDAESASARPANGRKRRDADEERPRRGSYRDRGADDEDDDSSDQRNKTSPALLVGGGVAVLGLVLIAAVLALRQGESAKTEAAAPVRPPVQSPRPTMPPAAPAAPVVQPAVATAAAATPVKAEPAEAKMPAQIEPATVQKVKRSTAYLRVTRGGGISEGSGFFGLEPGLVFTNAHVLGMLLADSKPPQQVEVVIHSGEPDEARLTGTVLGVDRATDLAVLRVAGDAKRLPPPLSLESAIGLTELQKVYIFGFPFGSQLGKQITVSESSVSALRKDARGGLTQVQVNGGISPGNSGGPIVDARGNVVGVSVAVIRGTQINFAIPGDFVRLLLDGRVLSTSVGEPYLDLKDHKATVKVQCIDPMSRIKEVKVEVWAGAPGAERPPSLLPPAPHQGDSRRQTAFADYRSGSGSTDVVLPPLGKGQVYWVQPVLVNGTGTMVWAHARSFRPLSPVPLERKNALLQYKYSTHAERTLQLKNTVTLRQGARTEQAMFTGNLEFGALELLKADDRGAGIRLHAGPIQIREEVAGAARASAPAAQAALGKLAFSFHADPQGALKERGDPSLRTLPPALRSEVEDMYHKICNAFEATCFTLPGRAVRPLDTWTTRQPMLFAGGGKKEVTDMMLTCTFEGIRKEGKQQEAFVSLSGEIKGRGARADAAEGHVTGHALVDLDQGFLSRAELHIRSEIELNGSHLIATNDITLTRSAGNTLGIKPPPPPTPVVRGKTILNAKAALVATDPPDPRQPGSHCKLQKIQLTGGKKYIFEMNQAAGSKLDPYLRLEDELGNVLAEDDDGGGNLNARIVFTAPQTGVYRLVLTSLHPGETGFFVLAVAEAAGG